MAETRDSPEDVFVFAVAFKLEISVAALQEIGVPEIPGFKNLTNLIRSKHPLGKYRERFEDNLMKSLYTYFTTKFPDGEKFYRSMEYSCQGIKQVLSELTVESPIDYQKTHLESIESTRIAAYGNDQLSATRRLMKLFKLGDPALSLPAQKDQFNMIFENSYKAIHKMLMRLLDDGVLTQHKRYESVERILSISDTWMENGRLKSDIRFIRNCFEHPDRIDFYDHYSIKFDEHNTLDLHQEDLARMTTLMSIKCAQCELLFMVFFSLMLYTMQFGS